MSDAPPTRRADWLDEVHAAMDQAESVATAQGHDPEGEDHAWWLCVEEQTVVAARSARGIDEPLADPDATMDEVTDITVDLRAAAPGDPDDHHINQVQHCLLYYVAAHVHAHLMGREDAAEVVRSCWDAALPPDEDDDPPWEAQRPAPDGADAWFAELRQAWAQAARPPAIRTAAGRPWLAAKGDLRAAAVALALHQRGCRAAAEAIDGLVEVLGRMESELSREGPEVAALRQHPPLAFALHYLWAHVLIGHADEEQAMAVVGACAARIEEFQRR